MFFEEHVRKIWSPALNPELKFDPLSIDRELSRATNGKLADLIKQWDLQLGPDGRPAVGDISDDGVKQAWIDRADAEITLARAARSAFNLPAFPDCTDAVALDMLVEWLWWMEGKGQAAGMPRTSSPLSGSDSSS